MDHAVMFAEKLLSLYKKKKSEEKPYFKIKKNPYFKIKKNCSPAYVLQQCNNYVILFN